MCRPTESFPKDKDGALTKRFRNSKDTPRASKCTRAKAVEVHGQASRALGAGSTNLPPDLVDGSQPVPDLVDVD